MLEPFGTFWFQKGVKGSGTLCEALATRGIMSIGVIIENDEKRRKHFVCWNKYQVIVDTLLRDNRETLRYTHVSYQSYQLSEIRSQGSGEKNELKSFTIHHSLLLFVVVWWCCCEFCLDQDANQSIHSIDYSMAILWLYTMLTVPIQSFATVLTQKDVVVCDVCSSVFEYLETLDFSGILF